MKIQQVHQLIDILPENEWIILDVLRGIIRQRLPEYCKEKISYNVPFFYGHRGICIIWPAAIPRGGIKEGVLLGFWQGNKLQDPQGYLIKGTNKKIFYKIYKRAEEIDVGAITQLLDEAIWVDQQHKISKRTRRLP